MKRIVMIYGLIAGSIVGAMLIITMPLYKSGVLKLDNGELLGYTTMVIALSLVFFGVKSYRDGHLGGSISFGNALFMGLLITLVASIIYALSWEISYNTMKGDFIKQMSDSYLEKMMSDGATEAELNETRQEMEEYGIMYKNPVFRFAFTLMEIAPVGIIISLISAGLLRRSDFLPASKD